MTTPYQPVLTAPESAPLLNLGSSHLRQLIPSSQTDGNFSVVEFISRPGEGVGLHVHKHEEELVYLVEGQIEITLGDQKIPVTAGACALLPRDIPHGYVNTGSGDSRLLAVLLPGRLDEFFVKLSDELAIDRPHEDAITALCNEFGLSFLENK